MTTRLLLFVCALSTLASCSLHSNQRRAALADQSLPHQQLSSRNRIPNAHMRLNKRKKMLASILAYTPASPLITSPLIFDKYAKSSERVQPNMYPHLTTSTGAWEYTAADWWTSGFYPGTLYLLDERKTFCTATADAVGQTSASIDWLTRARQWRFVALSLRISYFPIYFTAGSHVFPVEPHRHLRYQDTDSGFSIVMAWSRS